MKFDRNKRDDIYSDVAILSEKLERIYYPLDDTKNSHVEIDIEKGHRTIELLMAALKNLRKSSK